MRNLSYLVAAVLVVCWLAVLPCPAEEGEIPSWAESVQLVMFGGPTPGDLELFLNGEFVAQIINLPPPMTGVADMLQAGVNTFKIVMTPPEEPRGDTSVLRLQIAPIKKLGARQSQVETPLAQLTIPPELAGGILECTEEFPFWAGPPPFPVAELKERYYLVIQGPPILHLVTIWINDLPLSASAGGDNFFEITPYVLKGRNEVRYEFKPTCMTRVSKRDTPLEIMVTTGELDVDRVQLESPLVYTEHNPRAKKGKSFVRKYSFRGR